MMLNIPTQEEIGSGIAQVFDRVLIGYPDRLLSALIPVDKREHHKNQMKVINYVVDFEMQELCEFVNAFNQQLQRAQDKHQQVRLKALIYCHIMEADLPLTVCWNLLRILIGLDCDWNFHRTTSHGKREVCEFPNQKISELKRLSDQAQVLIGDAITRLWQSDLRNAFSHSQYCWMDDMLQATNNLSPISRRNADKKRIIEFTFDEIDVLFSRSRDLLYYFTSCYRSSIQNYKDGNAYRIQDGWVVWDGKCQWVWEQNA